MPQAEGIMAAPLAYHLIWTTYGTWLPGDARGWTKSGVLGIQQPDPVLEQHAREMMVESEVHLTPEQRAAVEQTIRKHCHIRNWILHAVNVRSNHVHVVVTCACDGEKASNELKLWGSRCLSDLAGLHAGRAQSRTPPLVDGKRRCQRD